MDSIASWPFLSPRGQQTADFALPRDGVPVYGNGDIRCLISPCGARSQMTTRSPYSKMAAAGYRCRIYPVLRKRWTKSADASVPVASMMSLPLTHTTRSIGLRFVIHRRRERTSAMSKLTRMRTHNRPSNNKRLHDLLRRKAKRTPSSRVTQRTSRQRIRTRMTNRKSPPMKKTLARNSISSHGYLTSMNKENGSSHQSSYTCQICKYIMPAKA